MALQEKDEQLENPLSHLEALYCEEERFDLRDDEKSENCDDIVEKSHLSPLILLEHDLFWEDGELVSLLSKEEQTHVCFNEFNKDASLMAARREAVLWILRVNAHYGFSALTTILAVNYFDRFISSLRFQRDKPWMGQLAAVACLSLAAKMEETEVPLLLDLQVEESKYVFEAKTIQRMELLVLSTLGWKMNPVTPFSFVDHIMRRLGFKTHLHWEFLWRCEGVLLSVIADSRFVCYPSSVIAAATMLYVIKEVEPCIPVEYQNQLMGVLKISEDKLNECFKLILELSITSRQCLQQTLKRKSLSMPASPNGVIEASFSCDNSSDSWAAVSSVSSSPEPLFKKVRALDQQMSLTPFNSVPVDVLGSQY